MWKVIVSPEFGDRVDLSRLTRDLITQIEKDLGTDLEWVAAEHHNTEHPHVHVVIRGVRDSGGTLRLSREFVQQGIRSIASDLCTRQLGYRTELDGAEAERREVAEKRLTSIDRRLLKDAQDFIPDVGAQFFTVSRNPAQTGVSDMARSRTRHDVARLAVLCQMGLAESMGPSSWRVRRDFEQVLRAMQGATDRRSDSSWPGSPRPVSPYAPPSVPGRGRPSLLPRFSERPRTASQYLQHPLFLDALQAPLQKIDLQDLLADLPLQIRHTPLRPARLSIARKCLTRPLAELLSPSVQHVRAHFQPARHLCHRNPLLQPPDGGQLELLSELPAYCSHDSILHSMDFES